MLNFNSSFITSRTYLFGDELNSKLDNLEPTICFIPGAGMDHRTAQMIGFDNLKDRCNIIAIDLPGHGYTTGNQLSTIEEYSSFCFDLILLGHFTT